MSRIVTIDGKPAYLTGIIDDLLYSGMEVSQAQCVASALEMSRESLPDLILVFEKLQGLDALDLLELKHAEPVLAHIPVTVVGTSSRRKLDCFRRGCDDFLELPADEPEIIFRICSHLRRSGNRELSGRFESISLVDLVQMLVATRQDGRLQIEVKELDGEMRFREGQVVFASFAKFEGERAFLELLRSTRSGGSFGFSAHLGSAPVDNIEKRTDHLLLSLANQIDEEG